MLDAHTISTTTLIVTIIGSVLSSSVLSSIITGLFNNSSKSNEWRSQHLIEDKNKVREHLESMNKEFGLLQYKKYEFSSAHIEQRKWLLSLLKMYQDINNPYSQLICDCYEELFDHVHKIYDKDLDYKHNNLDIYSTDQDYDKYDDFYNKELRPRIIRCDNIVNNINVYIGKYFAYYYPKPSLCTRIKQCLCCK